MALLHLRVVAPKETAEQVARVLTATDGAVAVHLLGDTRDGAVVTADVARECVDELLAELHRLDVPRHGMITMEPLDTAIGALAERAEQDAPGEAADAMIWDELVVRTGEDSTLTGTFVAFMVLATLLAAIGVVTDSQITIVGAMVVGPEFGPLAGVAVGLVRRRVDLARRAAIALVVGFAVAVALTTLGAAVGRLSGAVTDRALQDLTQTAFVYQVGPLNLVVALLAGVAGMVALLAGEGSGVLVGVFISVTTVPAAGFAAVAAVLGAWSKAFGSLAQLAVNVVGIVVAGVVVLLIAGSAGRRSATRRRRRKPHAA